MAAEFEMVEPNVDPDFPDRPQHPDFWLLSSVLVHNDALAEDGGFVDLIKSGADPATLVYMAQHRVGQAKKQMTEDITSDQMMVMLWMDAFVAGQRFQQIRDDKQAPVRDGSRRQRRASKGKP